MIQTLLSAPVGAGAGVPLRELGLVLLVACVVTYLTTGLVRWTMVRSGHVAIPRARDVHSIPKPRLGGLAMFTGLIFAFLVAGQLPALNRGFPPLTPDMYAVACAGFVIVVVGIFDDLYDMPAAVKLVGQVVGSAVMSLMGLSWYLIYLPGGAGTTLILDQVQSTLVTVLLTVTLINAINFVDGLDGLAAGVGMIAGGSLLIFSLTLLHDQGGSVSAYPPAMISATLVGICAGFLPHNFEPSRIFMGDSGSMLIGLMLAAASTSASGRISMSLYGTADVFALLSPALVVAASVFIPMLDLLLAVVRRVLAGKSPFAPDKGHLHHRLLHLGHTHRRVVLVLYTWVSVVALGAIAATIFPLGFASLALGVGILLAMAVSSVPVIRDYRHPNRYAERIAELQQMETQQYLGDDAVR